MYELAANLHLHTTFSDGTGSHADLAAAALKAGLDVILTSDHNVLVSDMEGYHQENGKRLLVLVGEEIHDRLRVPPKNHLLVFGAGRELSSFAADPQLLIRQVQKSGGICFLAHPYEDEMPFIKELEYSWVNWEVTGYTGLELWNGLSELKLRAKNRLQTVFYAFFPEAMPQGPKPEAVQKWDELLAGGARVVAVGGSDAHALHAHMGPMSRTIFPYEYHFRCVNTHLLVEEPLNGSLLEDRRRVLDALRQGHAFIGYDLPASTRGFRFTAQGKDQLAWMGDEIRLGDGVTLQVRLPENAECRLLRDGQVVFSVENQDRLTQIVNRPGAYRVEAYLSFLGKRRSWIYSNPIYVRA